MPLYEYECAKDGRFELIRRFSDPPLKKCPTCGGKIEKVIAAPAFQFKGTGWYVTDYAKKSGSGGESKDNKSETKSEKSESKSETKPESKSTDSKAKESSTSKDSTPNKTTKDSSAPKGSSPT